MIARMEVIDTLQASRPEVVKLFDQMVSTLPEGVYLTSVKQSGKKIEFNGVAQSSTRVSAFMRNIDASESLSAPELKVIQTGKDARSGRAVHAVRIAARAGHRRGSSPRNALRAFRRHVK